MPAELIDMVTLRNKLGQMLDRVYYQGVRFTMTKNGTAIAVLVPLEERHQRPRAKAVSTPPSPRKKGKAEPTARPGPARASGERSTAREKSDVPF